MVSVASLPYPAAAPLVVPANVDGLAFDRARDSLCAVDAQTGSLVRFDRGGARTVHTLEVDDVIAPVPIGGIAIGPRASLFATRNGGAAGPSDVVQIASDGTAGVVAMLARDFVRLGIAYDRDTHGVYLTEYKKSAIHGPTEGAIVRIDVASGERSTLAVGFAQPVGIAKLGDVFVVTDARARGVYRIDLSAGRADACAELAELLDRPGAICARGDGSVLVASYDDVVGEGSLHELSLDGGHRRVARGPWHARAIATDGVHAYIAARGCAHLVEIRL